MMSGNKQKAVNAFRPVRQGLEALQLPLMQQRRYNGITNAIEMLVEDGPINKTVLFHLRAALMALADGDNIGVEHKRKISAAFDKFEAQI